MSSLGGICHFDGATVDPQVLASLGKLLDQAGPDGGRELLDGNVGMSFRGFCTTRESRNEVQPFISADQHVLCWDGRLDNRDLLIEQLGLEEPGNSTDVAIVMSAYTRWGVDFLSYILGDFSLALWDAAAHRLMLARDALGTRPLYYHANPTRIIWSSELRAVRDLALARKEIDDEYIAGYLSTGAELDRTPYRGVNAIQPGSVLIIEDGEIRHQQHTTLLPKADIRYKSDSEYEEHFRELFRESVKCRLRSDRKVWAELSGGLDSSSIVCMAHQILSKGEPEAPSAETSGQVPGLETVSYVYAKSPTSDESVFISEVEAQRNHRGVRLEEDDLLLNIEEMEYRSILRPNPIHRFSGRHGWVYQQMRQEGDGVMLSGLAGDNVMWGTQQPSPKMVDWLTSFQWVKLHVHLREWSRSLNQSRLALLSGMVLLLLPRIAQHRWAGGRKRLVLFQNGFARRLNMLDRLTVPPILFPPRQASELIWSRMLFAAVGAVSRCYYRDSVPIDYSYPFLHLPLVQFALAIPLEQFVRPEENRSLQRRALRTVLPSSIASRRSKSGPSEALCRAFRNRWPEIGRLFRDPRVCGLGYIEPNSLTRMLNEARQGINGFSSDLSNIFCFELWLRALEG